MLDESIKRLSEKYSLSEARILARTLICHVMSVSLSELITKSIHYTDEAGTFINDGVARLLDGEPIQYVTGETLFCGNIFKTDRRALIPRPETEELVEITLEKSSVFPNPGIMDIGTGSGAIAISLALKLKNAHITAMDISADALALAKENAANLGAEIEFCETDILKPDIFDRKFHVIVSNPPYIRYSEQETMERNVLDFEPHTALFVPDSDPLLFYSAIAEFGKKYLEKDGFLCLEINQYLAPQTLDMISCAGYRNVTLYHDINKNPRIITAQL